MTELATRDHASLVAYTEDPTGGRLIAWAQAASAANQLAKALVSTTFVPQTFKGNVGDATAVILMGDELGLSPLAALRSIYAVYGAPALYARTMVALAQSHGHSIWTEKSTDSEVIVCGQRKGSDKIEKAAWTMTRAQKAGYTSNKKYASNPQEMLYSKAAAEIARKVAADVLAGVPYSVEDLELDQQNTTPVRRSTETTKAKRSAPTETTPEPDLEPSTPAGEPITKAQQTKMHACYGDLGITDRDERLADAAGFIGRDIDSSSDLSKDEASALIDDLDMRVSALAQGEAAEELFGADE